MIAYRLTEWFINAHYPYAPLLSGSVETGGNLGGLFAPIPARVPGCIHDDLLRAGMIPDPYYEMNSLSCAWVSSYWWLYETEFFLVPPPKGFRYRLHLEGIDYEALIYVNGRLTGEHTGMFTPFISDISKHIAFDGKNSLRVLLKDAPKEQGQFGYTENSVTQKARFTYKWDFSTRLVQLGLYRDAYIEQVSSVAFEDVRIYADPNAGVVDAVCRISVFDGGYKKVRCVIHNDGEAVVAMECAKNPVCGPWTLHARLDVPQPKLWNPNGSGGQELYTLTVSVEDEQHIEEKTTTFGFRTIRYVRPEGAPEDCLPFGLEINGERVYIKGVNIVPLDVMYGRVTHKQRRSLLQQANEAGINLVRIWGGGLIEDEDFYDICDELGLMVWQDFSQSSSGISNKPCTEPGFLKLLHETAEYSVKNRQHHPCLVFWCGGNELTSAYDKPSNCTDENLKMLKEIVNTWDGNTLFLDTTASGPREFLNISAPGTNYDVHGPWLYDGPEQHYDTFNRSDSHLHSEFGVPGMSNPQTVRSVLVPERHKLASTAKDAVWRHHSEWWDTLGRDSALFGNFSEDDLDVFIRCSQFVQAEGLRYAVEANRRRAFANVGSIVWQFNEPWPQISGTNLIDYYGQPKPAYYALKLAFRRVNPSIRYHKLCYEPGEAVTIQVWLTSDEPERQWTVTLNACLFTRPDISLFHAEELVKIGHGRSEAAGEYVLIAPAEGTLLLSVKAFDGQMTVENQYLLFVKDEHGFISKDEAQIFLERFKQLSE